MLMHICPLAANCMENKCLMNNSYNLIYIIYQLIRVKSEQQLSGITFICAASGGGGPIHINVCVHQSVY